MTPDAQGDARPRAAGSSSSSSLLYLLFAAVLLSTLALMVLSLPAGLYTVFGAQLSQNYSASSPIQQIEMDVVLFALPIPVFTTLGTLFVVLLGVYTAFLALAAYQGVGFLRALRLSVSEGYPALFRNPLTAMMVMLGATSLVTVVIDTVQTNSGIQTGQISGDAFALLVDLNTAPLLEETTFRLIMIGVPIFIIVLLSRGSATAALKVLWRPSSAWEGGAAPGARNVAYAFLVLSSLLFGYAHYAAGSGWGPGKISEAAAAGLALGWLYITYGFHTDVLMHWSVNYVGSVYSFLAQVLYGIPWTSNSNNPLDLVPDVLIIILLGLPSVLFLLNELLKRVMGHRSAPGGGAEETGAEAPAPGVPAGSA